MSTTRTEPEPTVQDFGDHPIIHASDVLYVRVIGNELWARFIQKQLGPDGETIKQVSGTLVIDVKGAMHGIGMAVDEIASAGLARFWHKPKLIN